jgi:hypothetical protein
MTNVGTLAWERERYAWWLEDGHEGSFEDYQEWRVDTTPAEFGGAA